MIERRRRLESPLKNASSTVWLMVYSDLMTNSMLFFLVLFAISRMGQAEERRLMSGVARAFAPAREVEESRRLDDARRAAVRALLAVHGPLRRAGATLSFSRDELAVNLPSTGFFDRDSAVPEPGFWRPAARLIPALRLYPYRVTVEGHTDDLPPRRGSGFETSWELSAARAQAVAEWLAAEAGVDRGRIVAIGRGRHRPVAPNDSPEHRAMNRRIAIVFRSPGALP